MVKADVGEDKKQSIVISGEKDNYQPLLDFKKDSTLKRHHEIGFIVALLVLLLLQFIFFYFGLPQLTSALRKSDGISSPRIEVSIWG